MNKNRGESWAVIIMVLAGWSSFSIGDMGVKLLVPDYSIWQIMATTSGFSILILGAWIFFKHGTKGFIPKEKGWHFARAVTVAVSAIAVVNAIARIPLSDFYGITFAAPFFILILVHFLLKEHVGWHRWLAVLIGFSGVIVLAGPKFAEFNVGYILAVIATLSIAISTIFLRKMGKDDNPALYGFFPFITIFWVVFPLSIPTFQTPEINDLWKFAMQIISIIGGQVFLAYAIASAKETASVSPFVYIQIVWGTLFGYFLFGDKLSPEGLIGLSLIIGAGIYMIYREKKLRKMKA